MIVQSEISATNGRSENDAKYRSTRAINSWRVIKTPHFATGVAQFRIQVTYPNGIVRMMAGIFADRIRMDNYILRWLPTFTGKERTTEALEDHQLPR